MSDTEDKYEIAGRPKPALFSRSVTLHTSTPVTKSHHQPQPVLDRSMKKFYDLANNTIKGKVKKLCSIFESRSSRPGGDESSPARLKSVKSMVPERVPCVYNRNTSFRLKGTEDRVVMYLTSLRGIRRTYEDCHAVRMIFRGFRVWVDERDICMDAAFKRELQGVLLEKNVSLPQVFIRGKHIGGAEAIKHLFEIGELKKLLEGFPVLKPGVLCDGCGDMRFVPCTNCSGSRKLFDEDEGLVIRCWVCNENGLIRCPECSGGCS